MQAEAPQALRLSHEVPRDGAAALRILLPGPKEPSPEIVHCFNEPRVKVQSQQLVDNLMLKWIYL
jgi:hypothetical protein